MQVSLRLLLRAHAAISVLLLLSLACIAVLSLGEAASDESEALTKDDQGTSEPLDLIPADTIGASESSLPIPKMTNQSNWAEHHVQESEPQAPDYTVASEAQAEQDEDESEALAEHDRDEAESLDRARLQWRTIFQLCSLQNI